MAASEVYSLDNQIKQFFSKACVIRQICDDKVRELCGFKAEPAPIQGHCSYTVFAGIDSQIVFQFRLKSLSLDVDLMRQIKEVYGHLAPETTFRGCLGGDEGPLEALMIYQVTRIPGVSYIEFQIASTLSNDSPERVLSRSVIVQDFARFFALSWTSPQQMVDEAKEKLRDHYTKSLELLLLHLPTRFHAVIEQCIQDMPRIFSLPMVLSHQDLNASNIIVNPDTCQLNGLVDWAEADISPFGYNLRMLRDVAGAFWLGKGWRLHPDHNALHRLFWDSFKDDISRELTPDEIQAIVSCRNLGCLMTRGCTKRLANEAPPVPVSDDDDIGRYNLLMLDGFLVDPETKFGLNRI